MKKFMSRKLFAFIVWIGIVICVILNTPENTALALKGLGWITGIYVGGQAAIDGITKWRGKNE